ncbi:hypothetical protein B296_00005044 [Ensete ventricosum]|uniref:Uncharacterized protein n=1 Tax=Ensete ventricosum TaxID=4639 RepID=A0A427BAF9_ENSVE|nr:hypothetical protein B296_00005044 [Ensete ventricosum]
MTRAVAVGLARRPDGATSDADVAIDPIFNCADVPPPWMSAWLSTWHGPRNELSRFVAEKRCLTTLKVEDAAVTSIVSCYTSLELLDLSGSSISDSGIHMICKVLPETLSRLLLALCPNITSKDHMKVADFFLVDPFIHPPPEMLKWLPRLGNTLHALIKSSHCACSPSTALSLK